MQVIQTRAILIGRHLACLAMFILSSAIWAQEVAEKQAPEKQDKAPSETLRMDTDLVSVDVTVSSGAVNHSVTGLKAEDFVVYENGVRQKISNFSTTDVGFNLVLVIDTSSSTRDEVELMRRAARRFLNELRPQDRVALIQFNEKVELLEDLTASRNRIEKALNSIKPGRGTSFYDALQLTINEVLKKVEGRKAIVALTDGVDSYGFAAYEEILPMIEQAQASLYFLEVDTESEMEARMLRDCGDEKRFEFSSKQLRKYLEEYANGADAAEYKDHCRIPRLERMQINRRLYESARRELREMAGKSGGRVYPVKGLQQLEPAYAQIAADLRTQYSLGYYPSNDKHDGQWRELRVEIKRSGLSAKSKPGYRAPQN